MRTRVHIAFFCISSSACTAILGLDRPERASVCDPCDAAQAPRDSSVDAPNDSATTGDTTITPAEPCRATGEFEERACGSEACAREFRQCTQHGWGAWGACACDGWRDIAKAPPGFDGRSGHVQVWTGERWIVWGGTSQGVRRADGQQFDPHTNEWRPMAASPLSPRTNVASAFLSDQLFIWGGDIASGGTVYRSADDGALYDPKRDVWTLLPPSPLRGAGGAVAIGSSVGEHVFVWGGRFDGIAYPSRGATYSTSSGWTPIAPSSLEGRTDAFGFAHGGIAYVMLGAGCDGSPLSSCTNAASFDLAQDTSMAFSVPGDIATRQGITGAFVPSLHTFVLWGGDGVPFPSPSLRNGAMYRADTARWENVPSPSASTLASAIGRSSFATRSHFGVWGGLLDGDGQGPPTYASDGALFDVASGSWSALPPGGPEGRVSARITAGGRDVFVWGGSARLTDYATGKILRIPREQD
jgi:hypothetical protein